MTQTKAGAAETGVSSEHPSIVLRLRLQDLVVGTGFVVALAMALFFRLYRLDTFLHWAFGDEMIYSLEGLKVLHGQYNGLLVGTWDEGPATYPYVLAIFQNLFGPTLHTDRMVSVLFGTLMVPLTALCGREIGLSWTGSLTAAALLAVSHWQAHFSRMVVSTASDAFFLLLAVYCLLLTYRRNHWWLFLLSGLVCGFAPYWFVPNRSLAAILVLWFLYLLAVDFAWVRHSWRKIALFSATFTLVVLPLVRSWQDHPERFYGPMQHVGIFNHLSYWADQHPGESTALWNVLWHQIVLGLEMFIVNGGPYAPWGGTAGPAMDWVTGGLLFVAVGFAVSRWRQPPVGLLLIWFTAIWSLGVVLTIDAPQMEHAVGLTPAAFLLIAILLDAVGAVVIRKTGQRTSYAVLAAALVLVSAALNYRIYFQTWGSQLTGPTNFGWQFYDAATYIAHHQTPHGTAIYSWGYPDEFFRFLAPNAQEFAAEGQPFRPASLYVVMAGTATPPAAVAAHVEGSRLEPVYDIDGSLAFTAIIPPHP